MNPKAEELKRRTKQFALDVMKVCGKLPHRTEGRIVSKQTIKASTSVAANYRAACRARSQAEFIAKIGLVVEEADETLFWLEFIQESDLLSGSLIAPILNEGNEILAIMAASQMTAKGLRG